MRVAPRVPLECPTRCPAVVFRLYNLSLYPYTRLINATPAADVFLHLAPKIMDHLPRRTNHVAILDRGSGAAVGH